MWSLFQGDDGFAKPYLTSSSNLPTISSQFILGHTRSYFCTPRTLSVTLPRLICMFRVNISILITPVLFDIQRILRHHPIGLIFPYQLPLYIEINFDIFSPYLIFFKNLLHENTNLLFHLYLRYKCK